MNLQIINDNSKSCNGFEGDLPVTLDNWDDKQWMKFVGILQKSK